MRRPVGETPRAPVTVAFMGLDGVGKSTQSKMLEADWTVRGGRPLRVHHASTKVPILRALKQRYHGAAVRALGRRRVRGDDKEGGDHRLGGGGVIAWAASMHFLFGSFLKSLWYSWRTRGRPLILDRCFLDDVVKVRWRLGIETGLSRLMMRTVPKPTLVVVLDGEPEETFYRKKAPTCTFEAYLDKSRILGLTLQEAIEVGWDVERIEITGLGPQEVFARVSRIIEERSFAARSRSPGSGLPW